MQFGTARFMAPETWLTGKVSHKSDIYALGVTLVELLCGRKLTRAPLAPDAFHRHVSSAIDVAVPDQASEGWREGLHALLSAMLAFEPAERPDAGTVHEGLLVLGDDAPGESLGRLARRDIPPLIQARKSRFATSPLLDPVELSGLGEAELTGPSLMVDPTSAAHDNAPEPPPAHQRRAGAWKWAVVGGAALVALVVAGLGAAGVVAVNVFGESAAVADAAQDPDVGAVPDPDGDAQTDLDPAPVTAADGAATEPGLPEAPPPDPAAAAEDDGATPPADPTSTARQSTSSPAATRAPTAAGAPAATGTPAAATGTTAETEATSPRTDATTPPWSRPPPPPTRCASPATPPAPGSS